MLFYCSIKDLFLSFSCCSYYCPQGTNATIPCKKGTYGPTEQLGSQAECKGCEPGEYCAQDGLNQTSGNCSAGFFCRGNASVNEPTDDITGKYYGPFISHLFALKRCFI